MDLYLQLAVCAAFVIGVTVFMATREKELARAPRMKLIAFALYGVGAVVTLWCSYVTVDAPPPLVEGDLSPKDDSKLDVTIPGGRYTIVVHGEMDDVMSKNAGMGHYTVEAKGDDGKVLSSFDGTLDKHVETRRFMKRGVTNVEVKHLEGRHAVPGEWEGQHITLAVTKEQGNLKGAMHVMVIPSPPSELMLLIGGFLLAVAGGVIDRRMKIGAKSYVGVGVAFYFTFALLLLESTHPLELLHLLAVVPMSLLLGAAAGGLARVVVKPFVKPLPGSVPDSGR